MEYTPPIFTSNNAVLCRYAQSQVKEDNLEDNQIVAISWLITTPTSPVLKAR